MAHTTTATATYSLLKYSRSYPIGNADGADWQHFTNPVLRLTLDVTKTEKSEIQNVRLKVIWTIQNGAIITVNDNSEIEDVDLLAFSSLPARPGALMNVPLKAVYRDMTVGVRYLHPLDTTNTSIFRRFQISFASGQDTNAFISSIRGVCPCKMSPISTTTQQRSTHNPLVEPVPIQESQFPHTGLAAHGYPPGGSLTTTPKLSAMPPPPVPLQTFHKIPSSLDLEIDIGSRGANPPSQPTQPSHASSQTFTAPSSSQTSVSAPPVDSTNLPLDAKKPTNQTGPELLTHLIFPALREVTSIYNLPEDALEHVIGDVIREDGFVSLVERLTRIWKVKSLVTNQ